MPLPFRNNDPSPQKLRWWMRRWVQLSVVAVGLVIIPYAFSRLVSPWRCVSLHALDRSQTTEETEATGPGRTVRVASYNIAHGRGLATSNWKGGDRTERRTRLDEIAELLQEIDADIVVLNEVDFDSSWSYSTNQARYLADTANYPYWAEQRNLDFRILFWKWRFGNAVLSRYPIVKASVVDLPEFAEWETVLAGKKRGVNCEIRVDDHTLRIIGTHLSHRSEPVRVASAKRIIADLDPTDHVTILAGDMNSSPRGFSGFDTDELGENAIEIIDASGRFQRHPTDVPSDQAKLTFHSAHPTSVIDWIFIPHDGSFQDYRVHPSTLSDHRLIYADVDIDFGPR